MRHWRCIAGCGACCRLDPAQRSEDIEQLDEEQRNLYLSMVGEDGWCIHYDSGGCRCRIYDSRPAFCRVENLMRLFADERPEASEALPSELSPSTGLSPEAEELAIACCRTQIRAEYGGRGRVMRRFEQAIRRS